MYAFLRKVLLSSDAEQQETAATPRTIWPRARSGRLVGMVLESEYELLAPIGQGGMGEVYRAQRRTDRALVAVKVLHPHLVDARCVERFRAEASVTASLPRDIAPRVLDACFEGEERFIVLEYLEGEDLDCHLKRRGQLPIAEALALLRQIAALVDTAHAHGVIHRDLKPANIFLEGKIGSYHRVRLVDFGIAKLTGAFEETTHTRSVVGTLGYMAPEQIFDTRSGVGPAADIFGLGAVAYECLCGVAAFADLHLEQLARIGSHPTPMPATLRRAELPMEMDRVLHRAMAILPMIRPVSGAQLVRALEQAMETEDLAFAQTIRAVARRVA